MIVDDQKAATAMWRKLLERTGTYVVQEENRGSQAVQAARDFAPDLIVLDVNMPEFDGMDVALSITRDRDLQGTPILFMTSLVSEREVAQGKRIDGFPCVAKPITVGGLVSSIEKQLAIRGEDHVRTLVELAA
jgi:CheY-like chemotaxis protein